jgi:chromosome segregation ATPase
MKSREGNIRSKRFQIEDKQRHIGQIESMIEEFNRMIGDLDHEIAAEHRRTGIEDENHFAYSTFARAATQRRENLKTSVADLQSQLDTATAALDLAQAELAHEQERHERETGEILGLSDEQAAGSAA